MTKSNDTKKSNLLNNKKLELTKKYYSDTKDTLEFDVLEKKDNIDFLESVKATQKRLNDYYLVTALKILSNILWLNGWWISLMFLPLFDWLSLNAIFHEAAHFSLSRNQYINQFACYF